MSATYTLPERMYLPYLQTALELSANDAGMTCEFLTAPTGIAYFLLKDEGNQRKARLIPVTYRGQTITKKDDPNKNPIYSMEIYAAMRIDPTQMKKTEEEVLLFLEKAPLLTSSKT